MGYWIVDGRKLTNEEYEELQRQEELEQQKAREEASRLAKQLGQAYAALQEHLRRNPGIDEEITDERELDQQIYDQLRLNLERADQAPRCQKIKADGTGCGSPKMKNHIYCYAHYQMLEARAEKLVLPALEDANAIQMAVMLVQRALIDDEITEKRAGLLLYSLQIAAANVNKTTFGQAAHEDLVTEMEDEEELLGRHEQAMEKQKKVEEIRKGKTLPRINTDNTDHGGGGKQNLPRMGADERGSGEKALPLADTHGTNQSGGGGGMLPQSASGGGGGAQSGETHAKLG